MPRTRSDTRGAPRKGTRQALEIENFHLHKRVEELECENAGLTELLNRDPASIMRVYGRNGRVARADREAAEQRQPAW